MTFTITIQKSKTNRSRQFRQQNIHPFQHVNAMRAERRYEQMIKDSQKKLAETTPVSYTQIWA